MAASIYKEVNSNYKKVNSKRISFCVIAIVLTLHGIVILFFVNLKNVQPPSFDRTIQVLQPRPDVPESVLIVKPPSFNFQPNINSPAIPDIEFDTMEVIQSSSDKPYELPNKNSIPYKNVFDPKVRQKLMEAQGLNRPRAEEKSNSWTEADGRTFIDMGDGHCLVSMPKVDSRDRGNNWGHTRCGKTDSENTMDRVMADFESRKLQSRD